MKKNILGVAAAVLICASLLTGCGSDNTITEQGMQQISALQYANALALFDEADEKGEDARLIARGRGIAYLGQAKYSEAADCFLLALSLSNGFVQDVDMDINFYLAEAYIGMGDYASAEDTYTAIIGLYEKPQCYYLRGNVRLLQGSVTAASDDFNRAIAMAPKDIDMIIRIFEALEKNGYRENGLEYLDNALASYENSMTPLNRGRIYYYKEEYQSAAVALEEARSADNNNSAASLYLGMTYEAVGENNYASNVYESYLARNPQDAVVQNQLAVCRMKLGDYAGALANIQAGMQAGDPSVMQNLAFNEIVIYEYLGEFQKADALITAYLEAYPSDETALREKIFLSTR
ncbi:MAG: tetratricopeptide repeat protein [Lachnospiraceae bacterium]|nr:tetratricopeptide repeat protein [Lachnospiraceae bacterium]